MTKIKDYDQLDIIDLPEDIQNELCDQCPGNPAGTIVNPIYHPKLRQWLIDNNKEIKPYFAWWSW